MLFEKNLVPKAHQCQVSTNRKSKYSMSSRNRISRSLGVHKSLPLFTQGKLSIQIKPEIVRHQLECNSEDFPYDSLLCFDKYHFFDSI